MKDKEYRKLARQIAEMELNHDEEGLTHIFMECLTRDDFDIDRLDALVQEYLKESK